MKKFLNLMIASGAIFAMVSCNSGAGETQTETVARVEKVQVSTLVKTSIARKIELSTTLQGYETMNIAPSVTGKIEHIFVEVGDKVKAGDMLVRMDQNQYNTTKMTFANLTTEYNRIKSLYETGTVSQQSYDQAKLSYDQTKESLSFLTENTFVKARFQGVISAKNYEDGELYNGQSILTLTQIHVLKALVSIPESHFPQVKPGMKLELHSEIYPDQSFPATIEVVYPTVDPATHTFQVKLKISNAKELLRPGMFVRTTLELGEIKALMAPYQAVLKLTGSNERYLFIDNNGVAKRIDVKIGQRNDEMVELISEDLKEGDQLVVVGQAKLVDGTKIEVVKK